MSEIDIVERRKAVETILYSITAITFSILCLVITLNPLDILEDDALILTGGMRAIDGQHPFVDIVDTNPPIMMYVTVIPTLLSYLLHIHPITSFLLFVVLITALSLAKVRRILLKSGLEVDRVVLALIATLLALFQLYFFTNNLYLYGQREHFSSSCTSHSSLFAGCDRKVDM